MTEDHAPSSPGDEPPPGTPRWVQILAVAVLLLVILVLVAMLSVGGEHGPGRHRS